LRKEEQPECSSPQMECSSSVVVFKRSAPLTTVLVPRYSLLCNLLRDILRKGVDCRFQAQGYSMSPFIKNGDIITISPLLLSPRIGDVVAFVNPETTRLLIHRIIVKKGCSYLMKGDNISEADGFIQEADILGIVTRIERNGKKVFIGLGPERFFMAFLTRCNVLSKFKRSTLSFLLIPLWRLIHPFVRFK
jgi:signal peptidase I